MYLLPFKHNYIEIRQIDTYYFILKFMGSFLRYKYLNYIKISYKLIFFYLRSNGMKSHIIQSNFYVFTLFGHPKLSVSLQRVRNDIFRPETFANSFLTTFQEKSRIFRVGQWGDFKDVSLRGFIVQTIWKLRK